MYNADLLERTVKERHQELIRDAEANRLARAAQAWRAKFGGSRTDRNHQMFYIFLGHLSILLVGMGLFPLLPIYGGQFASSPTLIGIYLAIVYVSITLGSLLAGWLARKMSRKVLLGLAGAAGVLALALLGNAASLWQVVALTSAVWFTGGVGLAVLGVLTGLQAEEGKRGKWFGLISLTTPLGAIAGGLVTGWLVDLRGYQDLFFVLALVYSGWPLLGLFRLDYPSPRTKSRAKPRSKANAQSAYRFNFLLLAALFASFTLSINRLGLSLTMEASGLSSASISHANVVGGLVTVPLVLWLGSWSDRIGRRFFLSAGYLIAAVGGLLLILSNQLWQFWLIAAFTLISRTVSASLSSALATDILDPAALDQGLPRLNTMQWISGVLGFAGSGLVIEVFGSGGLYLLAVLLALGAASLVGLLAGPDSVQVRIPWRLRKATLPELESSGCD